MPVTDLRFASEQGGRSAIALLEMAKEFRGVQGNGNMQALPWGSQGSYNVLSPYMVYVLANTLCVMPVRWYRYPYAAGNRCNNFMQRMITSISYL